MVCRLTAYSDSVHQAVSYGDATSLVWMQQSLGVTDYPLAGEDQQHTNQPNDQAGS